MNKEARKDCCNGCQNGLPGKNKACQAKLMIEAIKKAQETALQTKNL